jgi:hypothetical protein
MAVEKSKVIARLKALFPKANLSQKRLDALADKLAVKPADDADDVAIDVVINDFNSILSIEDIAREDDRVRTLESKANPPTPPTPPTPPSPPTPKDDVPAWAQALLDSNNKLKEDLEAIKTGKTIETKKQTASELFAKSEVLKAMKPELQAKWVNRIDINSETSFEDQIKELESEYSELVQVSADTNIYAGPAGGGSSIQKPDEKVVEEIVSNLNI